jgi:predicted flap endonuclease-1-like 5' DNA nuclease
LLNGSQVGADDQSMNRSQETRLKKLGPKLEQVRSRRYVFHYDEVAEAEAQGLPYVLAPRVSRREWMERYAGQPQHGRSGEREKPV